MVRQFSKAEIEAMSGKTKNILAAIYATVFLAGIAGIIVAAVYGH